MVDLCSRAFKFIHPHIKGTSDKDHSSHVLKASFENAKSHNSKGENFKVHALNLLRQVVSLPLLEGESSSSKKRKKKDSQPAEPKAGTWTSGETVLGNATKNPKKKVKEGEVLRKDLKLTRGEVCILRSVLFKGLPNPRKKVRKATPNDVTDTLLRRSPLIAFFARRCRG